MRISDFEFEFGSGPGRALFEEFEIRNSQSEIHYAA